jgi:hypothetical protein
MPSCHPCAVYCIGATHRPTRPPQPSALLKPRCAHRSRPPCVLHARAVHRHKQRSTLAARLAVTGSGTMACSSAARLQRSGSSRSRCAAASSNDAAAAGRGAAARAVGSGGRPADVHVGRCASAAVYALCFYLPVCLCCPTCPIPNKPAPEAVRQSGLRWLTRPPSIAPAPPARPHLSPLLRVQASMPPRRS